jgi:branched-chain amino acid transport system substrate-binding protein
MNKKLLITAVILLVALISSVLVATSKNINGPIKIGVILPLTGNAANYGEQVKKGIDIALKQINKDGNKIEVVYEDNQFDPKLGLSAYNKLVKVQGVKYLITFGGNVCPYINPLAQKDKIVNFATGCNTLDFNDDFSYNFRFDVSEREASKAIVSYLKTSRNPKTVALLYLNNDWGSIVAKTIKDVLSDQGIKVVDEEMFNGGSADMKTQLAKIKQSNPDSIFFLSLSNFTPILLKQIKELRIEKQLFTNISIQDPSVMLNAKGISEGILYSAPKLQAIDTSRNDAFLSAFPDPSSRNFASWGFDSLNLYVDALASEGDNPIKVATYLHSVSNYKGGFGLINYDNHGELKLDYVIKTIKDGKFVEVN